MKASKNTDFNYVDLPVLDMAHVRETIDLHRKIQEVVRLNRKRRAERLTKIGEFGDQNRRIW